MFLGRLAAPSGRIWQGETPMKAQQIAVWVVGLSLAIGVGVAVATVMISGFDKLAMVF